MKLFCLIFLFGILFMRPSLRAQVTHYRMQEWSEKMAKLDSLPKHMNPQLKKASNIFLEGIHYTSKDQKFSIGSAGLWTTLYAYNLVDGFWLGQTLEASYQFSNHHSIKNETQLYYTTARKRFTWQSRNTYTYSPLLVGKLKFNAGYGTSDYDTEEHLGNLENTLYSLIFGRNFMKLYLKRFIELQNSFYPFPGFRFHQSLSLERRWSVDNHTTFSFFKSNFDQTNTPKNEYFQPMPPNQALIGSLGFDYTFVPLEGTKFLSHEVIYSYVPTLSIRTVFGIPVGKKNASSFQFVEAYINQRFRLSLDHTMDYSIGGGGFTFKDNLYFTDFRHFGAYALPSMRSYSTDGYFLIGYYKADTDKYWIKSSFNFNSEHFALTQIPWFEQNKFTEALHTRYLWSPLLKQYTEWGYSLGYKDYARVGIFIGFEGVKYQNFGVSVSFPWLSIYY